MQRNGVYAERSRILQRGNLRDWVIEYGERSLYDLTLYLTTLSLEIIAVVAKGPSNY